MLPPASANRFVPGQCQWAMRAPPLLLARLSVRATVQHAGTVLEGAWAASAGSNPHPAEAEASAGNYWRIFEAAADGLIINDVETSIVVDANPAAAAMHGYPRAEFIGLHPTAYLHPDNHHLFSDYVEVVQAGEVFEAQATHRHRDGSPFEVELRGSALLYQNQPCLLAVIRNITERARTERRLQQQIVARTREQSTLLEISHTLASALELKPGLILDQLGMLIEYTHAVLFVREESALLALAVRGSQAVHAALPFRIWLDGDEVLVQLLNRHRPTRVANMRGAGPDAEFLQLLLEGQLEGVRAGLWVPMTHKDRVIGGVVMTHTAAGYFTAHHATLARIIANQAAITLVNAGLYEQAQALAALEERQRLAQNLHDAVNQSLFSAGLIAEVLPRLWERDPVGARESLEDLRRLTRGALAEMRGLLVELQPGALTDSDLDDLLRQLGNALTGRTNIPVTVTVVGHGALPADVQVAFYRLCQEALNNIAKHAAATQVTIELVYEAGTVEVRIRDDGRGFDPATVPGGHFGLSIMRERAQAVGAQLLVQSQPGQGTDIVMRWTDAPAKESP